METGKDEAVEQAKILIVDDEPLMCDSIKALLKRDGFEAWTGYSGQEALDCLAGEDFDVVLLDMHMPDMNGLQLMDHIRMRCPETFVIVITGQASVDSTVESLRRGAFDYLRKPFEHEELLKTVNNALNQKRAEWRRKKAEGELRSAHEDLERRVEQRTAELAEANAQLRLEIEERKRAEEELQEKNEEVQHFVRAVSHDLKNPIISIQGFSRLLVKHFGGILGEKGRGYVQYIVTNARRMELLVADLLTLSMIGRVVPKMGPVSTGKVVRDVLTGLEGRIRQKGAKVHVAKDLPVVHTDGERLYQVFENLLVNAVKFVSNGVPPRVDVGYAGQDDGYHRFFVRDNGIGIDPQFHRAVFEMFHRLQEVVDEEGTGLGLPIVERVLEKLGGRVWVESEKGKGATFVFTLPGPSEGLWGDSKK